LDGIEVLKEIKKINPSAKVYIVSAETFGSCQVEAEKIGIAGFIPKPVDAEKLFELAKMFNED
jgi:DNA-binding NtrC family response regulator